MFCFENRGEEIGVTLTHPHGQIYGYPFLDPARRGDAAPGAGVTDRARLATCSRDLLAHELADGSRVVTRTDLFTAFVPFAARWPVEVHIYPNRFVHNLVDLDDAELDGFAEIYLDVLSALRPDVFAPLPYMSALHQYADNDVQREGYFHVELMSITTDRHQAEVPGRLRVRRWTRSSATSPRRRRAPPEGACVTSGTRRPAGST